MGELDNDLRRYVFLAHSCHSCGVWLIFAWFYSLGVLSSVWRFSKLGCLILLDGLDGTTGIGNLNLLTM